LLLAFLFYTNLCVGWQGKVVGVSDGDTITVLNEKTPIKVRLCGIDCPEKKSCSMDMIRVRLEQFKKICFAVYSIISDMKKATDGNTNPGAWKGGSIDTVGTPPSSERQT